MTALVIDRVALRGGGTPARRRRALARLERIDPVLPGAPSEVLILRRLADPAPGALGRAPGRDGPGAWERALADRMARLRDGAVRPARGEPETDAEAVVFTDEVEMRACLAERMAAGQEPGWWARALLRRLPPGAGVAAVLGGRPHLLPALCEALVGRGSAVAVLAQMSAQEASALAGALDLPARAEAAAAGPEDPGSATAAASLSLVAPPPALHEALVRLRPATARLLAAGWLRRRRAGLTGMALAATAETLLRQVRPHPAPPAPATTLPDPDVHPTPPPHDAGERLTGDLPRPLPETLADRPGHRDRPAAAAPRTAQPATDAPAGPPTDPQPAARDDTATVPPVARGAGADDAEPTVAPSGQTTPTRLGGVLFLVNFFTGAIPRRAPALAAHLAAAERAADGPWSALERLARALLDPTPADSAMEEAADPLWRLLAVLDGRDGEASTPLSPAEPGPADRAAANAVVAWTAAAGWGADRPPASAQTAVAGLLRRPARIVATPAHLDVLFAADAVALPARRAGLDLDPGWQPRFGRAIAFHFRDGAPP